MSSLRRVRTALAVTTLSAAVVLFGATAPAAAHDQLLDSNPAPGERVDTAPEQIELTYTAPLITIGAVVVVVDAEGHNWSSGEAQLDGDLVVQPLEAPLPEGSYQVRWRVVSGDGHPISDVFTFGVGVEPTPFEAPAISGPSSAATAAPSTAESGEGPDVARIAIVAGIGAAAALAVYLITLAAGRRRGPRTSVAAPADAPGNHNTNQGDIQ